MVTTDKLTLIFIVGIKASRGGVWIPRPPQNHGRNGRSQLARTTTLHLTSCGEPERRARESLPAAQQQKLVVVAMQARAYPACLPGPAGAGCGRSGLLSSTCSVGRRTPAGRGHAASVRAVDGASAAAAVAVAADAAQLPPPQITWQIVVGAVGDWSDAVRGCRGRVQQKDLRTKEM
ncbi:unnamed protein product [Urochloa decumbens]|uniref:Uncharacterized protein n=1 Tax=Urochloa decumbens TaxID=240449 RepID=A0ABC8Z611_9POAL